MGGAEKTDVIRPGDRGKLLSGDARVFDRERMRCMPDAKFTIREGREVPHLVLECTDAYIAVACQQEGFDRSNNLCQGSLRYYYSAEVEAVAGEAGKADKGGRGAAIRPVEGGERVAYFEWMDLVPFEIEGKKYLARVAIKDGLEAFVKPEDGDAAETRFPDGVILNGFNHADQITVYNSSGTNQLYRLPEKGRPIPDQLRTALKTAYRAALRRAGLTIIGK